MKSSSLFAIVALVSLVGAGCSSSPTTGTSPSPPKVEARMTGCTPKAIAIQEPSAGASVKMPFDVKVQIHNAEHKNCRWTLFEGQAGSLTLQDDKGTVLGRGILATQEDWMTDEMVKFDGKVYPTPGVTVQGALTLVISEDDPSGEKQAQTVLIPVNVTP